jgi:hypothetical protein
MDHQQELVSWLVREIEDLLDAASVGLYELIWAINSRAPELASEERSGIAEKALRQLLQSSEIGLVLLKWPNNEVSSSKLRVDLIGQSAWNEPSQDGTYYALSFVDR